MKDLHIQLIFNVSENSSELPEDIRHTIEAAVSVSENAYSPYSRFNVGAAILYEDGTIHMGSNQENAAYPSGLCAERVAVFSGSALYPGKKIKAIAVYAKGLDSSYEEPVTPCGACRQALLEYENLQKSDIPVYMTGPNGKVIKAQSIRSLLPLAFGTFQLTGK